MQDVSGTAQDLTLTFGYTAASQLQTRQSSNALYDWPIATASRSYVPNALNQYATVTGTTYGYDGRGNLTSDGVRTMSYDVENRLLTVVGGAGLTLSYDPLGRLWQTTSAGISTQFLYDGDRLAAEYTSPQEAPIRTILQIHLVQIKAVGVLTIVTQEWISYSGIE